MQDGGVPEDGLKRVTLLRGQFCAGFGHEHAGEVVDGVPQGLELFFAFEGTLELVPLIFDGFDCIIELDGLC